MKRLLVSAAVLGLLSSAPAFAQAGPSSTVSTDAHATIVERISVTNVLNDVITSLNFGSIAAPVQTAGTVSVDASGNLTSSNPNLIISGSTGSVPTFTVTGSPGLAYGTTIAQSVSLTGSNGGTMTATLAKSGGSSNLDSTTGLDSFKVTGVLGVGVDQTPGTYSGSFDVTVQYN
jgi:hypothetical protein